MIAASGTLQVDVGSPSPSLEVRVNGVTAMGPVVSADCKYIAVTRCTLAGSWYLVQIVKKEVPGQDTGERAV